MCEYKSKALLLLRLRTGLRSTTRRGQASTDAQPAREKGSTSSLSGLSTTRAFPLEKALFLRKGWEFYPQNFQTLYPAESHFFGVEPALFKSLPQKDAPALQKTRRQERCPPPLRATTWEAAPAPGPEGAPVEGQ